MPPLLTVDVAHAVSEPIVRPMRFQSLIYSNYDATIQPRTQGYLLSKEFSKGMPVRKGQTLFTIDAAEVRLAVESNRSALSSAKVALAEATNNYRRAVPLAAIDAISQIKSYGGKNIKFLCVIAAPEGIEALTKAHPDVDVYCANVDEKLNENAYIVPGLGDAGDRIFGTK